MLAHSVYFKLKDNSDTQKQQMLDDCFRYLKDHPGVTFFAAGVLAEQYDRPVNVKNFDIALHVIFETTEAHDAYQIADDHKTFIERNKPNWQTIQVFDSLVAR